MMLGEAHTKALANSQERNEEEEVEILPLSQCKSNFEISYEE